MKLKLLNQSYKSFLEQKLKWNQLQIIWSNIVEMQLKAFSLF